MKNKEADDIATVLLSDFGQNPTENIDSTEVKPRLFVCFEHEIMEFVLSGKQMIGRPAKGQVPDIPITNKYVSRKHGYFETLNGKVIYTAAESTNGTYLGKMKLEPGKTVELEDGDELIIPVSDNVEGVDVMLACAVSESRINIWRDLRLSARDTLTGLSGRNAFRTWYLMNYSWKKDEDICLFILDIDKFKRINDVYGHAAGDKALKLLSEQLLLTAGNTGYICRWGGDEFTGILVGMADEVRKALDDMRERLSHITIDDQFNMTISAGVVDIRTANGVNDIDGLVMLADEALYKAKEDGRNCVRIKDK